MIFSLLKRLGSGRWRIVKRYFLLTAMISLTTLLLLHFMNTRFSTLELLKPEVVLHGQPLQNEPMCKIPHLPLYSPEIMKLNVNVDRITCRGSETDWVHNNGTHAFVTEDAKTKFGPITCSFHELERDGDLSTKRSEKRTEGQVFKFETSDFVNVECEANQRRTKWSSFLASPRSLLNSPKSLKQEASTNGKPLHPKLNVLIWGHDSLSRNTFMRKLESTYSYLKNELRGHALEGYNIVGDGTPQALIPILTGRTEPELPETRKSQMPKAQFVDIYPFIWKEFRAHGYLTGYLEDSPDIGTFQYRLRGFKAQPTDFYMRTYFVALEKYFKETQKYCIGSVPTHKIVMNYVQNIMTMKREVPKFVFSFHSELSHGDINLIEGADQDITEFLQQLNKSGILNETILIVMSDHGHRFSALRELQQGKLEERLPMFMFVFPPWFKDVYPTAYQNFIRNTKILSTPFDIHETLQDVLKFDGASSDSYFYIKNSNSQRGMSLFREIPTNRSCSQAGIEPHWCTCLTWNLVPSNSTFVQKAAKELVKFLNNLTKHSRQICSVLELSNVLWSASLYPNDDLMKFKQSKDVDGRTPDLSATGTVSKVVYQLKIETKPGLGHFEASINYDIHTDIFEIKEKDISRINKYGSQADCVQTDELESLRKYCYCLQDSPSNGH